MPYLRLLPNLFDRCRTVNTYFNTQTTCTCASIPTHIHTGIKINESYRSSGWLESKIRPRIPIFICFSRTFACATVPIPPILELNPRNVSLSSDAAFLLSSLRFLLLSFVTSGRAVNATVRGSLRSVITSLAQKMFFFFRKLLPRAHSRIWKQNLMN